MSDSDCDIPESTLKDSGNYKLPFPFESDAQRFSELYTLTLQAELRRLLMEKGLNPPMILNHGASFTSDVDGTPIETPFELMRSEITVHISEVMRNDFAFLKTSIEGVLTSTMDQLMRSLYSTISKGCKDTGNVVNALNKGFAFAFIEMLKKIELAVDEDGAISFPQIHSGRDPQDLLAELESQPLSYKHEVAAIKYAKVNTALDDESLRLSKYKGHP